MGDENTVRLKLTSFQARTLYTMLNAREWDEIEEMTLVGRLNKSIEEFLILKGGYTRETIRVEVKKAPNETDFEAMMGDIVNKVISSGIDIEAVTAKPEDYEGRN